MCVVQTLRSARCLNHPPGRVRYGEMSRGATEPPSALWCCSTCGAIYYKDFPRCPVDGAEVVITHRDPLLGAVVGNYTIEELLGEGGMGRVYLAHHANLPNKRYAFKVLLGDHAASPTMRTRFAREAERASRLDHPNVVKVVDFGQTVHGLLYIVMDYVDGPSLHTLVGERPLAPVRVVGLVREICKGLGHAHAAGIVHRDLKPENILVEAGPAGPVPRLVDFGLAVSLDQSDARLTESGMTMGTPAFAAPEQLAGKPIDHRADLYALGLTMFEMLTGGRAPFEGTLMEVVSARTTADARRIREVVPELELPVELEDIVARLTRRAPDQRYATAREVIDAYEKHQKQIDDRFELWRLVHDIQDPAAQMTRSEKLQYFNSLKRLNATRENLDAMALDVLATYGKRSSAESLLMSAPEWVKYSSTPRNGRDEPTARKSIAAIDRAISTYHAEPSLPSRKRILKDLIDTKIPAYLEQLTVLHSRKDMVDKLPDTRFVPCAIQKCPSIARPKKSRAPAECHAYLTRPKTAE